MATTKILSEAERLEKLMPLAQRSHKFGSMQEVLSPEFRNRPRDFSELTARLAGTDTSVLPTPEQDRLMRTTYGLPLSRF